jgi:autotransporter-associated beta strand protein
VTGQVADLNGSPTGGVTTQLDGVYQQYTYTVTADASQEILSFTFRNDPSFSQLDDISLTPISGGANLVQNPGFEGGTTAGQDGVQIPNDWIAIGQQGLAAAGTVDSSNPHSGSFSWDDGSVGGQDGIAQAVSVTAGDSYTLSFWYSTDPVDNGTNVLAQVFFADSLPSGFTQTSPPAPSLTPIDTSAPFFLASNLGSTVTPDFQGGVLETDITSITPNFTVEAFSTNTIDSIGNNAIFSGVLSGAGGLTIEDTVGGGSVTFTGVNTYTGATIIDSSGTLALAGSGSIAASSGVADNGVFDISQTTSGASIASLSGSGLVALGAQALTLTNANGTFSGVIADGGLGGGTGGSLVLAGGTETLTGANTYTGSTTINSGATLALGGSGSIATSSGVADNGVFDISQTTSGASIASLSGSGAVALGSQALTLTNASGTFSGVIADGGLGTGTGGSLILAGGTETLTGANTYTGATAINSGAILALGGSGSIATSSGVADNGVFDISQTSGVSIASLSGSGVAALGGQALTLTNANGTFSGVISDGGIGGGTGGSLILASGTETLTGANTYTGATTINAGATLALAGSGSIAASSGVTANGAFDISQTTAGASVATLSGSGSVALGGQTLTLTKANGTFSGAIADGGLGGGTGGSLTIAGGTETLTGVNTYTGSTTINSGATLALVGAGAIAASAVTANGTFDISHTTSGASIVSLSGSGLVNLGGQVLTLDTQNGIFTGVISDSGVGGATVGTVVLATGTQILTGNNTYTGNTAIATGTTLQVGNGGTSGAIASNVADDGTLMFDRADTVTYSGVVFGTGALTQAGPGTTILDGVNTVTGVTTVAAGVLEVGDASHASASLAGNVVVGAAGTLRGHGTIAGSVTNTAGGTVAPGGTIGTLTVGSYTQGANSTLAIEVSPTAASELNVLGAASLNGKLALTFDPGTYAARTYQIVSAASLTGTFSSVTQGGSVPGGGLVYSLSYGAKQADLVVESTGGAQIYGGIGTATLDEARGFASLVEDRSGDAGCADGSADTRTRSCQMGAWAQAIASTDNVGTSASGFGFNNTGAGAMGGLDRRVGDNATVGVAFGFEQNDLRMGGASATASGSSYYGAVYAHWIVGPAWIDGQGFYMRSNWAVDRANPGSGVLNSNPNGGTKGFLVQASAPIGSDFRPYARFTYANFDRDGVTETGVNGAGFILPLASSRTALAEAGLQWAHSWVAPGGIELRPALEMGVQNDLADQNRDVIGSLEGIANTGFTVSSVHLPPTAGVADASLKVRVTNRFELTADLRDRFNSGQTDASASFGGLFRF